MNTSKRINFNIIKIISLLLVFNVIIDVSDAQNINLNESLFLSTYEKNYWGFGNKSIEGVKKSLEYCYSQTKIESSNEISSFLPIKYYSEVSDSYSVQLFKITSCRLDKYPFYMIKYSYYSGIESDVLIRASGYIMNDMKLLFDFFQKKGVKKKNLIKIIEEWEEKDELFKELNLRCILKGVLRNSTSNHCFASSLYKFLTPGFDYYNCDVCDKKNINSVFSEVPYFGDLKIYGVFKN